jgi:hypothetical protein
MDGAQCELNPLEIFNRYVDIDCSVEILEDDVIT